MKTLEQIIEDEIADLRDQTRASGGNYQGIFGKTRKAQLEVLRKILDTYKGQSIK